jgi:hypothetical protein
MYNCENGCCYLCDRNKYFCIFYVIFCFGGKLVVVLNGLASNAPTVFVVYFLVNVGGILRFGQDDRSRVLISTFTKTQTHIVLITSCQLLDRGNLE